MGTTIAGGVSLILGILLIFVSPIIPSAQGKRLSPNDFKLQVFLPTMLGLILAFAGYMFLLNDKISGGLDEQFFQILIIFTSVGGILVSHMILLQSNLVINYQAD
jgi:hypothetical protein